MFSFLLHSGVGKTDGRKSGSPIARGLRLGNGSNYKKIRKNFVVVETFTIALLVTA